MPADASLYGAPRPKKNQPISLSSTSIHALSTELALLQQSSADRKPAAGRARPSKTKSDLFKSNKNVAKRAARDEYTEKKTDHLPVSERELQRSQAKLRAKAKLYNELKRGDGDGEKEGLVDFVRKWAEDENGDDDDDDDDNDAEAEQGASGDELVEYEDEFGRTRTGKKRDVEREKRQAAAAAQHATAAAARPAAPDNVIYGSTIQTHAFQTPEFVGAPAAEALQALVPSEEEELRGLETHYDASREVRSKGVGFFQFSTDPEQRKREMEELMRERERTEREKKEAAEKRSRKRKEIEERKELVRKKRRGKVGGKWLEGFMGDLGALGEGEEGGKEQGRAEEMAPAEGS